MTWHDLVPGRSAALFLGAAALVASAGISPALGGPAKTVEVKASSETQLTTSEEEDYLPSFSPDGQKIAFTSYASGSEEIWVMNADGSAKRQLTDHLRGNWSPAWSPDSRQILFTSDRTGSNQIWVMEVDNSKLRQLTFSDDVTIWSRDATWSPDGKMIVFTSNISGKDENWVMDRDGKNWTRHLQGDGEHWHPSFGPDGKTILFSSNMSGEWGLWLGELDGSNMRRIASDQPFDNNPSSSWSPNGELIAYRTALGQLWVARSDGSDGRLLVDDGEVAGWRSSWSPDGKKIAYTSSRSGNSDIWIITLKR